MPLTREALRLRRLRKLLIDYNSQNTQPELDIDIEMSNNFLANRFNFSGSTAGAVQNLFSSFHYSLCPNLNYIHKA